MKLRTKKVSVLALAATAAMAVAGAGAGSAQAACTGSNIHGEGSSLQGAAQRIWTTGVSPVGFNGNTNGGCVPAGPRADYTVTSSGRFLNGRWGADGVTAFSATTQFGGTDDAPTSTQITALNTNLRANVLSIPVAQAAIAIVVNPPSGCSISSITGANLEAVFRGGQTWDRIGTGSACTGQSITRVVRNDSSGTTYQLKHFLFTQNSANVCSSRTATWRDLQSSANNQSWPSVCDAYPSTSTNLKYSQVGGTSGRNDGSGGGDEAKTVKNTANSIGYVALADARGQYTGTDRYKWLRLDTGAGAIDPSSNGLSTTVAKSNCTTTSAAYGTTLPSATASWADVYLVRPGTGYGLCTLTWDLASDNYAARTDWTVGGVSVTGANVGATVRDFLGYAVTTAGGQADALSSNNDYQILPNSGGGTGDVQAAARTGVASIR